VVDDQGVNVFIPVDTVSNGVEFWLDVSATDYLAINFSGVVMDSEQEGSSGVSAPVPRLPETQLRLSPTLYLGNTEIAASIQYFGERAERDDVELPSYTQIDLGATYRFSDNLAATLKVDNLTNEFGFTSGNFRGVMRNTDVRYNSTIPGRTVALSVNYNF